MEEKCISLDSRDLTLENQIDNFINGKEYVSSNFKEVILSISNFVFYQYENNHPSSITIYQHCDGCISIECDNSIFCNIHYFITDSILLEGVAYVAEHSSLNGKMFLYSKREFLSILYFKF